MLVSILPRFAALVGVLSLSMLGGACGDEQGDPEPDCDGAKCDDPTGTSAHAVAVLDCDQKLADGLIEAGDSLSLAIEAHASFSNCLVSADNGTMSTIEKNLLLTGAPLRSLEEIATVFDEYRYASLCVDIESASPLRGDALDLQGTSCDASRERSLAEVIGAFVDFGDDGTNWELGDAREPFESCYRAYDDALVLDDSPETAIAAGELLVFCASTTLRAEALPLAEARCEQSDCLDEFLTLIFVQAGFETAITTSDRACQLLVDSNAYQSPDAPGQFIDCRMTAYAGLATQVAEGLP